LAVLLLVFYACINSIVAKAGRYGGTYAHKDIAFEFATCLRIGLTVKTNSVSKA
jgi:hypothetical protein